MYLCNTMKLKIKIKSAKFKTSVHKVNLNILYIDFWLKSLLSKALKEFELTHKHYNVLKMLNGKHPEESCASGITVRISEKKSNEPQIINWLVTKKLPSIAHY